MERFQLASRYDFTAPPHLGRLWYELFDWRVTGAARSRLASRAASALGFDPGYRRA